MDKEIQEKDNTKFQISEVEDGDYTMGPFKTVEELMKNTWDAED